MKRILYIFTLSLLLLSALLLLGCEKDEMDIEQYYSIMEMLEQKEAFAEKVYVIIPEKCSGELSIKARELANAIKEKTKVGTVLKYDNEDIMVREDELAIFLGNTGYICSQEAMKPLRYGDYLCRWDGEVIVLGGRHDDASVKAVDEFIEKILHGASSKSLMGKDAHFESKEPYAVRSVRLNGYDLYDYTIVYSDDNAFGERDAAQVIRDYIVFKSGYVLNMIPLSSLDDTVGKTLSFKGDKSLNGAEIINADKSIAVRASGIYEMGAAAARLADMLFEKINNGSVEAELEEAISINCKGRELKIAYSFSRGGEEAKLHFISEWSQKIKSVKADIFVLDNIEPWLVPYVKQESEGYGYISLKTTADSTVAVLYNRTTVNGVELESLQDGVSAKVSVKGELEARSIILTEDAESECTEGNMLILKDASKIGGEELHIGTEEWNFKEHSYSVSFYIGESLEASSNWLSVNSFGSGEYMGIFIYTEVKVQEPTEYTELKNALE